MKRRFPFQITRAFEPVSRSADLHDEDTNVQSAAYQDDAQAFDIHIKPHGNYLLVSLIGALDDSTVRVFRRAFEPIPSHPARLLVFDMNRVPYVDSDGFGALIHIQKRLTETGRSIALVGCQEPVRIALSLTRLEVLFPHYPSIEVVPGLRQ